MINKTGISERKEETITYDTFTNAVDMRHECKHGTCGCQRSN